ncbi:MAG: hypothetical protein K9H58_19455 [Bacteroidales bacterium]|nr:hypothetical protein [Bacteroidales bacterium]
MVKGFFFGAVLFLVFTGVYTQEVGNEDFIEFKLSFSQDTVAVNDSIQMFLSFKNITDSLITFYPSAIIGLNHYHPDVFITYSEEHLFYSLRNELSCDNRIDLYPNMVYEEVFYIVVDSSFFYIGKNEIWGLYHFHSEKSRISFFNKRKKQDRIVISLSSSQAELFVQDDNSTFIE